MKERVVELHPFNRLQIVEAAELNQPAGLRNLQEPSILAPVLRGAGLIDRRSVRTCKKAMPASSRSIRYKRSLLGFFVDLFRVDDSLLRNLKSALVQLAKKTAAESFVTGRTHLFNIEQNRIGVAVDRDRLDMLIMTAGLAFDPQGTARPRIEGRPFRRDRPFIRLAVHPSQHQNLSADVILNHRRQETVDASCKIGGRDAEVAGRFARHGRQHIVDAQPIQAAQHIFCSSRSGTPQAMFDITGMKMQLCVIQPVRNQQDRVIQQFESLFEMLEELCQHFGVIAIDAASEDATEEILGDLGCRYPQLRVRRGPRSLDAATLAREALPLADAELLIIQESFEPIDNGAIRQLWQLKGDRDLVAATISWREASDEAVASVRDLASRCAGELSAQTRMIRRDAAATAAAAPQLSHQRVVKQMSY